jgi:predicted RNA methylase
MADDFRKYWDRNIEQWGDKYGEVSHGNETFDRPALFTFAYNSTIGRIERRLMKERYRRTIGFLDLYVKPGVVLSDIGCGVGVFVIEALKRGAIEVNAIDFSSIALQATREAVDARTPGAKVNFIQADAQKDDLPTSDVALTMGVTPYFTDIEGFLSRALGSTKVLCCYFTDPKHWASRIRRALPVFDVRSLQCYDAEFIDTIYARHRSVRLDRRKFASGYIDVVVREDAMDWVVEYQSRPLKSDPPAWMSTAA